MGDLDPFGKGPKIPPNPDFDGEPMTTDEVERAMMADMAERMAAGELQAEDQAEAERREELRARSAVNGSMALGALVCVGGLIVIAATGGEGARLGGRMMVIGAVLFGAGAMRG